MVINEDQVAFKDQGQSESDDRQNTSTESRSSFTVDQAIEEAGFGWFQWKVLFITGAIWAADAMEIMFITFIIPILREQWELEAPWDAMIGIVIFTGMFLGAFGWSTLADKQGRRYVVLVTNVIVAVFGTLSAFSPNFGWMLCFRMIVGIGLGGSAVSYTLFAEYCPTSFRGKALIMEQGFWSVGALASVALAWITLTNIGDGVGWRWYIGLSALPSWCMVMAYPLIPESARYYSACGQGANAETLLRRLFTENNKCWPEGILSVGGCSDSKRGKVWDLFVPAYRKTSFIMLTNFFTVTFCYYGICFISERLFKSGNLFSSMFLTTLSEVPGILFGVFFLDKTGRKGMMNICWAIFAVLSLVITCMPPRDGAGSLQTILDVTFVFISRCAVSTLFYVLYVYFSEYYPTVIRAVALGFGSSLTRFAGMITTFVAEDLSVATAMLAYTLVAFMSLVLALLLPQDTTGLIMKDQVDRGGLEMSWYSRNTNEENGDDLQQLHGGVKGKMQQFRAYAFSSLKSQNVDRVR